MLKSIVTVATEKGPRPYQEDRIFVGPIPRGVLLAVMDGHGGDEVSEMCAEMIPTLIPTELVADTDETEFIRKMVSSLAAATDPCGSGSTLSIAWIREDRVVVAILGDSPVVIMDRFGELHIGPEHNVKTNLAERKAAIERGGSYYDGYIRNKTGEGLQMSRALGDSDFRGIISRVPEIYVVDNPAWVLVCTDGLIDSNHRNTDSLIQEMSKRITKHTTAEDLVAWAVQRRLEDNATAVFWQSE